MQLGIKLLDSRATMPKYAHPGDSGMDVFPLEKSILNPGEIKLFKLGFALQIPHWYEIQIRPRSGMALKGITIVNTPATIDSGFVGEVGVILINHSDSWYKITPQKAIAQLVLCPIVRAELFTTEILKTTYRGKQGYGSSDFSTSNKDESRVA